jgi:hypothetical protein
MDNYCKICHQFDGCQYPLLPPNIHLAFRTKKCPNCNREVELVDISTACTCLGLDPKTLYRWRKRGWVTSVREQGGRPLIYWSSLFRSDTSKSQDSEH